VTSLARPRHPRPGEAVRERAVSLSRAPRRSYLFRAVFLAGFFAAFFAGFLAAFLVVFFAVFFTGMFAPFIP